MHNATLYDSDGRFTSSVSSTDEASFNIMTEGHDYVAGPVDGNAYYYDRATESITLRPAMAVVATGNVLTGLPAHCIVECNRAAYNVDDGIFEYETPLNGRYHVRVTAFPYLDWEGEITVENNTPTE